MFLVRSLSAFRYKILSVTALVFLMFSLSALAMEVPFEVQRLLRAAQQDMQGRNFDSAQDKYQAIIRKYPDAEFTATVRGKRIEAYLETGQAAQAEVVVDEMMAHADASAAFKEALHGVGRAYRWKAGDPAKGREVYTRWLEKFSDDPQSPNMQCSVVKSWIEDKNIEGARRAMERFKELCVGKAAVTYEVRHLADVFRGQGHPEDAIRIYQWFIDTCPHPEQVNGMYTTLIETHLRLNKKDRAAEVVEKLLAKKDANMTFSEAIMGAGRAYRWTGQNPAAGREIYNRWLDKFSDDPEGHQFQCAIVKTWIEEKNVEGAEKALERFKHICEGKADVSHEVIHLADVFRDNGRPDTSMGLYRWFLATCSQPEQIHSAYAAMINHHLRLNNRAQADAVLDQLMGRIDKSAAFKDALNRVGQAYRGTAKDPVKAQEIYSQWVETFSDDPDAFKLQSSVVLSLLEANDIEGVSKAMDRFKHLCEGKEDVFREMAYLGLNFRNHSQFDKSLDLYHWFTGQSAHHLERFLMVYATVRGFKDEVDDALNKSSNPRARSEFLDQLIRQAGQSRDTAGVITFYAEHCGGSVGDNALKSLLHLAGDGMGPPMGLPQIIDVFNRQKMGATSVQLCQSFLAEHPNSEHRPLMQLKLYESMLAGGTEAATIISYLEDFFNGDVPEDSDLIGRAITLKGQAYIHMAESAKAMACFRKVIQEYPQYPSTSQAVFFLGYCHLMANEFDKALQTLESLINNYPDSEYDNHAMGLLKRIVDMT